MRVFASRSRLILLALALVVIAALSISVRNGWPVRPTAVASIPTSAGVPGTTRSVPPTVVGPGPSARETLTLNGGYVTPSSVGGTVGAGTAGPDPTDVVGSQMINTAGTVLENVVVDGCVTIRADNVTIRNVAINCGGFFAIRDVSTSGTSIENVTIDCLNNPAKGITFDGSRNFKVDRVEITRCDDQLFIDGGLGDSSITNSVFHNQTTAGDAHTDGMQIGEFTTTTGTLTVASNWWEYNRSGSGCCATAVLFATNYSALTINLHHNYLDGDFGVHILRCVPNATCNIEYNTLNGQPDGLFYQSTQDNGTARCNRYTTGQLIPNNLYAHITVNNTNC